MLGRGLKPAMRDQPPEDGQQPDRGRQSERDRTIIDVSGERPEVVEHDENAEAFHSQIRVYTARGGPAGCIIPLALLALLLCCSCIGVWAIVDNLF